LKNFIGNFWTFLLAVAILPVVYGLGAGFWGSLSEARAAGAGNTGLVYFLCGFIFYVAFQIIFSKPIRVYVFGHELTHAIAGILSGGKVKSFKVGKNGGSVTLTKAGLFATLSPYFLPVYSAILILVFAAAQFFLKNESGKVFPLFMFLFGSSVSFHIFLTVFAISQGQSDLKKYGVFFSLVLVLILNILILELIFAIFFKAPAGVFIKDTVKYVQSGYSLFYNTGEQIKCLILQTMKK